MDIINGLETQNVHFTQFPQGDIKIIFIHNYAIHTSGGQSLSTVSDISFTHMLK